MDNNPFRPPQTKSGMTTGNQNIAKNIGLGILGFLSAGVIASTLVFLTWMIATSMDLSEERAIFVAFLSFGVFGPLSGFGVWHFSKKKIMPFAIGGLMLAIASFLLIGGCGMILFSLSSIHLVRCGRRPHCLSRV